MEYMDFLALVGLTQAQMDAAAASMPEPIPRAACDSYVIAPSAIEGLGCFATRSIDGCIGLLRRGDEWTEAGRYINHDHKPNARAVRNGRFLMAMGCVKAGQEITLDYAQVRAAIKGEANV